MLLLFSCPIFSMTVYGSFFINSSAFPLQVSYFFGTRGSEEYYAQFRFYWLICIVLDCCLTCDVTISVFDAIAELFEHSW